MYPGRKSNANVECWFNSSKHNIHSGKRYMRPTHFIREQKESIKGLCSKILSGVSNRKKFTSQKQHMADLKLKELVIIEPVSVAESSKITSNSQKSVDTCDIILKDPSDIGHEEKWEDKHKHFKKTTNVDAKFTKLLSNLKPVDSMKIEYSNSNESLEDLSETVFKKPAYEHFANCVIINAEYYKNITTHACVIGVYEKSISNKHFHRQLYLSDILTLKSKTGCVAFLSDAIIDLTLSLKSLKYKEFTWCFLHCIRCNF